VPRRPELNSEWARNRRLLTNLPVPRVRIPPTQGKDPIIGSKKKTTFAKLNRETKLLEKRREKAARKAAREASTEDESREQEDLSHLDVAHVEGVERS
jgi:hypothetical protein